MGKDSVGIQTQAHAPCATTSSCLPAEEDDEDIWNVKKFWYQQAQPNSLNTPVLEYYPDYDVSNVAIQTQRSEAKAERSKRGNIPIWYPMFSASVRTVKAHPGRRASRRRC